MTPPPQNMQPPILATSLSSKILGAPNNTSQPTQDGVPNNPKLLGKIVLAQQTSGSNPSPAILNLSPT